MLKCISPVPSWETAHPKSENCFWLDLLSKSKTGRTSLLTLCHYQKCSHRSSYIVILTAKISSYIRTTFSFKGFLEDDVLLSKPAFFSTWDMIRSAQTLGTMQLERSTAYRNKGHPLASQNAQIHWVCRSTFAANQQETFGGVLWCLVWWWSLSCTYKITWLHTLNINSIYIII